MSRLSARAAAVLCLVAVAAAPAAGDEEPNAAVPDRARWDAVEVALADAFGNDDRRGSLLDLATLQQESIAALDHRLDQLEQQGQQALERERQMRLASEAEHRAVLGSLIEVINQLRREGIEIVPTVRVDRRLASGSDSVTEVRLHDFEEGEPIVAWLSLISVSTAGSAGLPLDQEPLLFVPAAGQSAEYEVEEPPVDCLGVQSHRPWFLLWQESGITFRAGCVYPQGTVLTFEVGMLAKRRGDGQELLAPLDASSRNPTEARASGTGDRSLRTVDNEEEGDIMMP